MIHRVPRTPRTVQIGLVIATIAILGACSSGPGASPGLTPSKPVSELIVGTWEIEKYQITYDLYPDTPIDVAEYSEITYRYKDDGTYSYECFPACFTALLSGEGRYTINEQRKSIRVTVTYVNLTPQFEHLRGQIMANPDAVGTYTFLNDNRYQITSRQLGLVDGQWLTASLVEIANRAN